MKKLFLDDVRKPWGKDWDLVRNFHEFKKYIEENGCPDVISFDHDLSTEHYAAYHQGKPLDEYPGEKTGYDCAQWLVTEKQMQPKYVIVHSWNHDGARRIAYLFGYNPYVKDVHVEPFPCPKLFSH